ncbi:MAG TPA: hypothetical protein PKE27_00455 [Povalibacter sp.]|uniref:hypothetical protein n=1 Tax=Povalibacter sp. TaxID=1962978 RepID=UPI002C0EA7E6|nr:hypothetical protein [Povalibacter sp.]HMN43018.1 hypothetical protein [Povalibacter sp.]
MSPVAADSSHVLRHILRGRRILLVEDDDQLYRALRECLVDAGAEVLGALAFMPRGTGLVPLTYVDVAIIDASHAGTGIVLARELQQRGIACVLLAAAALPAIETHGCCHLSKPFTEAQLLDSVSALIRCSESSGLRGDGFGRLHGVRSRADQPSFAEGADRVK